jgi:ubiquinone/menaquinone biosynthesis C-methylase UbiE
MASLLPAHARITATDLNQQMLSQAMARQSEDPRLAWKQADALTLPFEDQSFNVVACQFGVMFFPDKVRGYKEAYRVLRPGGRFFFNVWDRISKNEFADVITDALAMVFPQDPPRFLAQTSYGYFHKRTIRDDLKAAGFTQVLMEVIEGVSNVSSAREAAVAFCLGTPLRNEIEARDPSRLEEATIAATNALAKRLGSRAIEGRMRAVVITAMR